MKVTSYGVFEVERQDLALDLAYKFNICPREVKSLLFTAGIQAMINKAASCIQEIESSQRIRNRSSWFTTDHMLKIQKESFAVLKELIGTNFNIEGKLFDEIFTDFQAKIDKKAKSCEAILYKAFIESLNQAYTLYYLTEEKELLQRRMLSAATNVLKTAQNNFAETFLNNNNAPSILKESQDNYNDMNMHVAFVTEANQQYLNSLNTVREEHSFTERVVSERNANSKPLSL